MTRIFHAVLVVFISVSLLAAQVMSQPVGSTLVGTVVDSTGKQVGGVKIVAQSPSGKVIGEVVTDNQRQYVLQNLAPGKYHLTLDPLNTPFKGETVLASVGAEGLTVNWAVSAVAPAMAMASPGPGAAGGTGGFFAPGFLPFVALSGTFVGILYGTGAIGGDPKKVVTPSS